MLNTVPSLKVRKLYSMIYNLIYPLYEFEK